MKAAILSLLISFVSNYAQITITNSDYSNMFTVGNEFTIRENTGGGTIDIGNPGGGNAWDFSWFTGNLEMDISVIDPATSPYINEFPGANIATYSMGEFEGEEGEIWSYSNLNGNLGNLGSAITVNSQPGNLITIKYTPPRIEAELPLTFNSAWSEMYTQIIYFNGTPFVQSSVSINVIVDAYGIMTLPGGEIFEALRIRESMTVDGQTTTVSYTFLSKSGAQVTLNAAASNPPTSGEIAVESYTWNFEFSGGSMSLIIIIPDSASVLIAGENELIKYANWTGTVDLHYSLDDGENFELIDSNYYSDFGNYYWDVPDSLLTRKAIIKVVDSNLDTANSKRFNIKPWQLTRLDENEEYELFELDKHGWSIENTESNMWPQSWWNQFDYENGIDPYTNLTYPDIYPFYLALDSEFPDWPMFVDLYGINTCYIEANNQLDYREYARTSWGWAKRWGGSCNGFAVTSLMGFFYTEDLISLIGSYDELYQLSINNTYRYVINKFQNRQFSADVQAHRLISFDKTPRTLLIGLDEILRSEVEDARLLAFFNNNGSGGHAVVPFKLERVGNSSNFKVFVYNSNTPNDFDNFIFIDSVANTWSDSTGLNWGTGFRGCYLDIETEDYLSPPTLTRPSGKIKSENSINNSRSIIFNTIDADIVITSETGGQIGYEDSIAFHNIPDAVPIIPLTGYFHPPVGYDLPEGSYSLELNNFSSNYSYVLFRTGSSIYNYRRFDSENNETDVLRYSEEGLGLINPDNVTKEIEMVTIIDEDSVTEKVFMTSGISLHESDSIKIKELNGNNLLFNNYGDEISYDLEIRILSANGLDVFEHSEISMAQNSGHQIVPDWNNLQTSDLKILIDIGNDGTIDDSIFVKNQTTNVKDEGSLLSPDRYNLAQNYPNPFNPSTTIQYSIPQRSNVMLKVYDILGNEVAVLVNEEKDRGVYSVSFNADKFSSGVYFYKIQAENYIDIKKMILLK